MDTRTMDRVGKVLATAILLFALLAALAPKAHANNFTIQIGHNALRVPTASALRSLEADRDADVEVERPDRPKSKSTLVEVIESWLERARPQSAGVESLPEPLG